MNHFGIAGGDSRSNGGRLINEEYFMITGFFGEGACNGKAKDASANDGGLDVMLWGGGEGGGCWTEHG